MTAQARGWQRIVDAFRVELAPRRRARPPRIRPTRCPACALFVKQMCDEPFIPCGVCTSCCPGYDTHQPAKKDPT